MFLAIVGMCETNAYCAFKYTTQSKMSRFDWLESLSEALLNNHWLMEEQGVGADAEEDPEEGCFPPHSMLVYHDGG